jgi:hypothetical protein
MRTKNGRSERGLGVDVGGAVWEKANLDANWVELHLIQPRNPEQGDGKEHLRKQPSDHIPARQVRGRKDNPEQEPRGDHIPQEMDQDLEDNPGN